MSSKFWFLTGESFKKKVKSKWFIVVNIILCVFLIAICNIDRIITYFGGDFDSDKEIIVIDETGMAYDILKENLNAINTSLDLGYEIKTEQSKKDVSELKNEIKETDKVLVLLENTQDSYMKAQIISDSYVDTYFYQVINQALAQTKMSIALMLSDVDLELYNKITSPIEVERIILNEEETDEEELMNTVMGVVFPTVTLPFFILVVFLVQMIGTEINEEKSSRSMEIIISNVSPKTHFFSKILAGNGFVFMQGALLIFYGALGLLVRLLTGGGSLVGSIGQEASGIISSLTTSGIIDKLVIIIPITLVLLILSFIAYSLVAGILASMTVSMEDFNQIQTPIMFICLIGYYLSIMSGVFSGSLFIKVVSYIPFISCLLSPALLITNQIGIVDVIISILILCVFNWALVRYGLKIYKIGILNYSTDKMWMRILKAAKEK